MGKLPAWRIRLNDGSASASGPVERDSKPADVDDWSDSVIKRFTDQIPMLIPELHHITDDLDEAPRRAAPNRAEYVPDKAMLASPSVEKVRDDDLLTVESEADRRIIKLWREGHTERAIADRLSCPVRTMHNKIIELRKRYTKEMVPYHRQNGG